MILLCYRHFLLSYLGFLSREGEGVLDLLAVHLENMVGQLLVPDLSVLVCGLSQRLRDKESACNSGDLGLTPGWDRSPGGGNGNSLQCSCLENPMVRGTVRATVHGVAKSRTQLNDLATAAAVLLY